MPSSILGNNNALLGQIVLALDASGDVDASDSLTLTDVAAGNKSRQVTAADTLSLSDVARHVFDALSSDTLTITDNGTSFINRPGVDTITFTDSAANQTVFKRAVSETITFTESASDKHSEAVSASDTLVFFEANTLRNNHVYGTDFLFFNEVAAVKMTRNLRANDLIVLSDSARGWHNYNVQASETITFKDQAVRVRYPVDKSETVTFTEAATVHPSRKRIANDQLIFNETATNNRVYVRAATDVLALREEKFIPAYNVFAGAVLGFPVSLGVIIYSNAGRLNLPRAEFGDHTNTTNEFKLRYAQTGNYYTYIRRRRYNRRFVYSFEVSRLKEKEIVQYFTVANANFLTIINWRGEQWLVKLLTNPIQSTNTGYDRWRVELDFEGVQTTSGGVDVCQC